MEVYILIKKNKKTDYKDIYEIEKIVDEIIFKNKKKLERPGLNSIDQDKFNPKNTKNKTIFYFKKNKNKKDDISKRFSVEIISRARKNLGEKSIGKKFNKITPELKIEQKIHLTKPKIWLRFDRKNKEKEKENKIKKTDDSITPKDFDTNVSKIKKTFVPKNILYENEESKNLEEKIKNKKEENTLYSGLLNSTKKNTFINNKNLGLIKNKKYDYKTIKKDENYFSNNLDDNKFLNQNIRQSNEKDLYNNNKKETEQSKDKNKKKIFSKKTISDEQPDYINNKSIDINSTFKPLFKVENIPNLKDDEKIIIDEGIKKTINNTKQTNEYKKVEDKARRLFEEHKKDFNDISIEKSDVKVKHQKDIEIDFVKSTSSKQEHVFFNEQEQESDFNGWSPNVINKERKELKDIAGEIYNEPIKELDDIELPKEVLNIKSVKLSDLGFSENQWGELDFYPLIEPYAYVEILKEHETLEKRYFLVEAEMSEEEQQMMNFIYDTICNINIDTEDFENKGEKDYLVEIIKKVIKDYNLKVNKELFDKILYYLSKSSLGFGKIDPLMCDPNIEDISCDGNGLPIFVYHRKFGSLKSNIQFDNGDELNSFVNRLAQKCGKHISIAEPMLDATMPDGSRIQMTLSDEITTHGSTFTIRKFRSDPFSPPDLFEFNTMSAEMIAYMWIAVENRINMLFSGGTASGKTTSLNALSLFIPSEAKIVSIEETREITLPHPNWIPGVSRSGFGQVVADKVIGEIDTYDLMKAALRQRPEFIIVGEIRGREAYVLFQAMATGHATYSTVHADSANSLIHRLEGKPIEIPRVMLQALDIVSIHIITSVKGKRARRCKQIIEIIDIDPTTKEILTNEVFRWDPIEDKFIYAGRSYVLEKIRTEKDISHQDMIIEIKRRKKIIELMSKGNIRTFNDVARLISRYSEDPDQTLNELEKVIKSDE
jgi:flagellar protein FlaI